MTKGLSQPAACAWCKSKDTKVVAEAICAFKNGSYGIALCADCGLKFAHPFSNGGVDYEAVQARHTGYAMHIADNEWIHSILARGPESHWTQQAIDFLAAKTMDSRYLHVLRIAVSAAQQQQRLKILEVGCNLGYVGAVLQRLGHDYTGVDVQGKAIDQACSYYGNHYRAVPVEQFARQTAERFDLVCSFEVIEHVLDPRNFVETCVSLLVPEGRLVVTTPNGDQMRENEWLTDFPPIHVTIFQRRTFEKLKPNLNVTIVDDLQHNRPGPHAWGRLRRRLQPANTGKHIAVMDPSSPAFVYGPTDMPPQMPYLLERRDIFRRAVADAASLTLGAPVGYCMIVEITRGNHSTNTIPPRVE